MMCQVEREPEAALPVSPAAQKKKKKMTLESSQSVTCFQEGTNVENERVCVTDLKV